MDIGFVCQRLGFPRAQLRDVVEKAKEYQRILNVRAGLTTTSKTGGAAPTSTQQLIWSTEARTIACIELAAKL